MLTLRDQTHHKATLQDGEYIIHGKDGQIALYQDGSLDIWITKTRKANKLILIWKPRSTYDDGACFIRPASDLLQGCKAIKARKRRQVTEAMRQRGRELMARMRSSKEKASQDDCLREEKS